MARFEWDHKHTLILRKIKHTHTVKDAAKIIGCSERTVHKFARINDISMQKYGDSHHRTIYSDEDIELARQLNEEGVSCNDISEKMEIPVQHVRHIVAYRYRQQPPQQGR